MSGYGQSHHCHRSQAGIASRSLGFHETPDHSGVASRYEAHAGDCERSTRKGLAAVPVMAWARMPVGVHWLLAQGADGASLGGDLSCATAEAAHLVHRGPKVGVRGVCLVGNGGCKGHQQDQPRSLVVGQAHLDYLVRAVYRLLQCEGRRGGDLGR